jgi:hypothetical protein
MATQRGTQRKGRLHAAPHFFLTMDTRPDVPMLTARLRNTFGGFGDDMLRISGVGEFATSWPLFGQKPPSNYTDALR